MQSFKCNFTNKFLHLKKLKRKMKLKILTKIKIGGIQCMLRARFVASHHMTVRLFL